MAVCTGRRKSMLAGGIHDEALQKTIDTGRNH